MSRNRNRPPRREPGIVKPVSAESKLLWHKYYAPMQSAAAQFNAAINNTQDILARVIMEKEGFDPDTHTFDADNLRIISRPNSPAPQLVSGDGKVE